MFTPSSFSLSSFSFASSCFFSSSSYLPSLSSSSSTIVYLFVFLLFDKLSLFLLFTILLLFLFINLLLPFFFLLKIPSSPSNIYPLLSRHTLPPSPVSLPSFSSTLLTSSSSLLLPFFHLLFSSSTFPSPPITLLLIGCGSSWG